MGRDRKGTKINNDELSHWSALLKEWVTTIINYCDFMKDDDGPHDAPYYYNERANIGILAASAWKKGWIALEEFPAAKKEKKGRGDLYIHPKQLERGEYIEAKLAWTRYDEKKNIWNLNSINSALSQAVSNAKELRIPRSEIKIGVLFITPYIHKKSLAIINQQINRLIKEVSTVSCDALAWVFPDSVREIKGDGQYRHFIYPGVFLLAKIA